MEKHGMRKALVLLLCIALFMISASVLFMPNFAFSSGKNNATVRGLYQQPNNSMQVLFLGTSSVLAGVSPTRIYE